MLNVHLDGLPKENKLT